VGAVVSVDPVPILFPAELVDRIAERAAELVEQRRAAAGVGRRWMTVAEAADHARCRPQHIYNLRSAGVLARTGDGGRALVDRRELDELIEGGGR
jgi:Helix-turn-helix domain